MSVPWGHPSHPGIGTPVGMSFRVSGIPAALHMLASLPDGVLPPTIEDTLNDIMELGIDLMSINVINSIRTDKSTGALAASIEGHWERTEGTPDTSSGTYELEVGSGLPYAGFASREIGLSTINANVLIQPGKWRWIGTRGPIPGHNFLERTLHDLNKIMPNTLTSHFARYMGVVQDEVTAMERAEL